MLITGIACGVILVSLAVAAMVSARRASLPELCRGNLRLIDRAMRAGDLFSSDTWDAAGTGRQFLLNHPAWPVRQGVPSDLDLSCPVKGNTRVIDYRGPARRLREMKNDEAICADRPGNHGADAGGNVLLRDGTVLEAGREEEPWRAAMETTSD